MIWTLNIEQLMTLTGSQAAVQMAHVASPTFIYFMISGFVNSKRNNNLMNLYENENTLYSAFCFISQNIVKTPELFQCAVLCCRIQSPPASPRRPDALAASLASSQTRKLGTCRLQTQNHGTSQNQSQQTSRYGP